MFKQFVKISTNFDGDLRKKERLDINCKMTLKIIVLMFLVLFI